MRRFPRLALLTLGVAALGVGVLASAAGAGGQPTGAAPLTIVKTVSGTVPAGTTFTATINCSEDVEFEGGGSTRTVTFDASGHPTSADTLRFIDGPGTCTVTETATGGASSTSYACAGSVLDDPPVNEDDFSAQQEVPIGPICVTDGPQATAITVNIVTEQQEATSRSTTRSRPRRSNRSRRRRPSPQLPR